ncbi:DEAD/DEAH box helicase [Altererythrobacter xixiisoli]|uniref:Transcription-repair-coupling factor n=2 Tax=Croceibacterium xixiisoli TaxID=1476466 RepID=A0A6I4TZ48_9SPHN|nr:DEAD/DEAH box helicase [Croceibacterium xixiisoli]
MQMTAAAKAIMALPPAPAQPGVGETVIQLANLLQDDDVLHAAVDESQAAAVALALAAAMPDATVLLCPGSDALPGDNGPASPANIGMRVSALREIRQASARSPRTPIACITTGEALARLYPPPAAFDTAPPRIAVDAPCDLTQLFEQLQETGYLVDDRVDEPGEVALRGQVLDVYPADAAMPLRIEVADGIVASIRFYDPVDQRTVETCDSRELGRVAEPPLDGAGVALPVHLPQARIVLAAGADDRRKRFLALAKDAEARRPKRALVDVAGPASWKKALAGRDLLGLQRQADPPPRFVEARRPMARFRDYAQQAIADGRRIALLGSERDLRFLCRRAARTLKTDVTRVASWREVAEAKPGQVLALAMPVDRGFALDDLMAISAADLLGSRAERAEQGERTADTALLALEDIRLGDVVVHEDHGIGIVGGLQPMPAVDGSETGDGIALTYADDGLRLVPVAEADRIWRYGAEPDAVTLDRLDGKSWEKRRKAIDAAIAESASALTALVAARKDRAAPVLEPAADAYERFASGFAFTETADQARAIAAVRDDLASGKPMDRLIVGDVGYGKTEVALRAAALAALAGHQVAIAAPTTVLVRQHLETFTQRFDGTGIAVAGLSRLSTPAEKKRVKAGLADGSIGIVIGTGAIAGKDVVYRNLGLVVIDEEQRFGSADKARMRDLADGHVLTLSATPIPRTLQNALIGLQQISVIATPPARRQPIRTSVSAFSPDLLRIALLREKSRGGQSFVVVPRIEDMAPLAEKLARLVPELELLQAHGKMAATAIDEVMVRFGRGEGDVLLATNIIEAGLDVPRANTMIIWRPDRFGLSQLHQLRGRVGRGGRRGQVFLLTEETADLAPRTLKRLRTLEAFDRLGAGFAISARDLDMRGAGDLLGDEQAGHMKLIGIELYQHLLESALRAARGEDVERWTPELNIGVAGCLPEAWLPDEEIRVTLYCRLARLETAEGLALFAEELEDRFGSFPPEVDMLLRVARVRLAAREAGIARIDAGPAAIALTPRPGFSGGDLPDGVVLKKDRLVFSDPIEDPHARLERLEDLLAAMAERAG